MVWVTKFDDFVSPILPERADIPKGQSASTKSTTKIDYVSNLNISSRVEQKRLSGIVCTIGPASKKTDDLMKMIDTGMNIARMNFSHGSYDYHGDTIKNCREAVEKYTQEKGFNPCLAIALDTKGPEIRTGLLEGDDGRMEITFEKGDMVKLTTDENFKEKCTKEVVYLDYQNITKVMDIGKRVFIDDGLISVIAKEIGDNFVIGEVENGGNLGSRKGCNLPGTDCDLPAVSAKDKKDLLFGVEQGVDMVFASFIRDAAGVREIREVLGEKGKNILIIPKIENQQGINNIDEIIAESDGIMVARGDMGIEIPPEKVFIAQKMIIAKCNKAGKPVINATQMLESMVKKPRATRAEGTDVANAILDGADCVMLSGETAKGDYFLECVQTMAALSREAEACVWNEQVHQDLVKSESLAGIQQSITSSAAIAAVRASLESNAKAILVLTTKGSTAKLAAKYRPKCPVLAIIGDNQIARQMQLHRSIIPILNSDDDSEKKVEFAIDFGKKTGVFGSGDNIVIVSGTESSSSITIQMV